MTEHILQAYRIDIETLTNPEGNQRAIADGWKGNAHEIRPGVMQSYGYRFDTPDRSIVISGDTNPTEETIKACNGCDVLVHEAQILELYAKRLHSFVTKYHTTTGQLAALATEAKPKLLVVYHTVAFRPGIAPPKFLSSLTGAGAFRSTPEVLQEEISSRYSGQFVIGRDLDVC